MALNNQMIPIPFTQGVSTKDDPKQVPLGKLLTLENGYFQTPGEVRKIPGFSAFGKKIVSDLILPDTSIDSGNGLMAYNDGLVLSSPTNATLKYRGRHLYSYSPGVNQWSLVNGPFVPAEFTVTPSSITTSASQSQMDEAVDPVSGLKMVVWRSGSSNSWYSIIDTATNTVVRTEGFGFGGFVKAIVFNGYFFAVNGQFYTAIKISDLSKTNGSFTSNINASGVFDVCASSTRLYYIFDYTTTGIGAVYLDTSFVLSSEVVNTSHAAGKAIGCSFHTVSSLVGIAYSNNSNVYSLVYTATLGGSPTAQTVGAVANVNQVGCVQKSAQITTNNTFWVFYCAYTNHSTTNKIFYGDFNAGSAGSALDTQLSVSLVSKPFIYGYNTFFLGRYGGPTTGQPTLFLFMLQESSYVGPVFVLIGKVGAAVSYDSTRTGNLPEVSASATGVYHIAINQNAGENEIAVVGSTWGLKIDFTVTPQSAVLANTLHITGGQLWMYDSVSCVEHGFHLYPDSMQATQNGTGVLAASSSYEYIAVYEWVDGQGQLHRSAPSNALSITTGGSGAASVDVVISTLRVTNKILVTVTPSPVLVTLYRTAANGTIFYFIGTATNDPTVNTVTINDANADAAIIGNVQLYTTGGQVDNSSAPSCSALATYRSRLFVVPSDNPYSVWYSQEVIPNSASSSATPVELSEFFIQNIDQTGGPLTGISSMDDKLILMKNGAPYYMVGNGPAPNGSGSDYSAPQVVTSPVGAVNAHSIVMTPMGIVFQAANGAGIWLLDRALGPSYIGSDVETYNSQTVLSANLCPALNQVRFLMSGGVTLAYDYYMKQWYVMTGISAVQSCLFQGQWTYATAAGLVLQESTSLFTNNGSFVQTKIGTSWIQLANLQGFQRIYEALILGEYASAHTLIANVYYDFDPTIAQTTTITPTSTPPYQWRLLFNRQKCEAIKIELYDSQISPAEGMRLSAISLKVGVKGGLNRMPAARTFE